MISSVYFGLVVGMFLAYIVGLTLAPLTPFPLSGNVYNAIQLVLGLVCCYVCISLLMQTRNDFRFIIPYVEFARDLKGSKPCVLDTSVIIDGRIADVVETQVLDGQLVMPNFVISELQAIADSSDRMRRSRGRRGLDILNRLRSNPKLDVQIFDRELPEFAGQPVDLRLVALAKHLKGRLVTNDYNLNKVARIQDVDVHQPQRPGQRPEAEFLARRADRGARSEGGGGGRTGRWLSRRRHDGGDRGRPRAHRQAGARRRDQRLADQRRPDDLRSLRGRPLSAASGN